MKFFLSSNETHCRGIQLSLKFITDGASNVIWVGNFTTGVCFSSFFGNYTAGWLGSFYPYLSHRGFFLMLTLIAGTAGVVMFVVGLGYYRLK